jgi:hypothetical protein
MESNKPRTIKIRGISRSKCINFRWGVGNELILVPTLKSGEQKRRATEKTKSAIDQTRASGLADSLQYTQIRGFKWNCYLPETRKVKSQCINVS